MKIASARISVLRPIILDFFSAALFNIRAIIISKRQARGRGLKELKYSIVRCISLYSHLILHCILYIVLWKTKMN